MITNILISLLPLAHCNWDIWWNYEGFSGPSYWGLINPEWTMCNKGRAQSPVNIDPGNVLFDPTLTQLHADKHLIRAKMANTGQTLLVTVSDVDDPPVNITNGPLQYTYRFSEIILHWGKERNRPGSEHSINHHSFPAELQIYGFNSDLYSNMSVARQNVRGVVAISLMVQVKGEEARMDHDHMHSGLGSLISKLSNIKNRGDFTNIAQLSLASILPSTGEYITYEGSTTYPGCWETVTWILMNKPVYISSQEMNEFHKLSQEADKMTGETSGLGNNLRPRQNLNQRVVRTNIDFQQQSSGLCSADTERQFQANAWLREIPNADLLRYEDTFF